MSHFRCIRMAMGVLLLVAIPLAASPMFAGEANICNEGEFWEGLCLTTPEWEAGWYLHADNDPGEGQAVDIAYSNYPVVIQNKPHSMCIDWRSANCDGTTPPPAPVRDRVQRSDQAGRVPISPSNTPQGCIEQANTTTGIDGYCRSLISYDGSLTDQDEGYNSKLAQAKTTFEDGLTRYGLCFDARDTVIRLGRDYTAGELDAEMTRLIEANIVTALSWTCIHWHYITPPYIPSRPTIS